MKKKILTVILLMIILIGITTTSMASSFTTEIYANMSEVTSKDEVLVTLNLSNIEAGDRDGINAIKGSITFDQSILTYVTYTVAEGWLMQDFNTKNGTFAITRTDYTADKQDFITFTFKVREDVPNTTTDIKVIGLEASFGQLTDIKAAQTVVALDSLTTLKIIAKNDPGTENPGTENPDIEHPNTDKPSIEKPETEKIKDNTKVDDNKSTYKSNRVNERLSDKMIPKAGGYNYILIVIAVLAIIVVISYVSYKKYKKD